LFRCVLARKSTCPGPNRITCPNMPIDGCSHEQTTQIARWPHNAAGQTETATQLGGAAPTITKALLTFLPAAGRQDSCTAGLLSLDGGNLLVLQVLPPARVQLCGCVKNTTISISKYPFSQKEMTFTRFVVVCPCIKHF